MKQYFEGYYCRDDLHLQVLNKDSNRKILAALRDAYPKALTVEEIASKTRLPVKTIYAQKAELYREYYVDHAGQDSQEVFSKRGRPPLADSRADAALRKRVSLVVEETSGIFDPYGGSKPTPLPPGNVIYAKGLTSVLQQLVEEDEQEDLHNILSQYAERILTRIVGHDDGRKDKRARAWSPDRSLEFCCPQCGLNHEARDFIRAILLHLIDDFQRSGKYIELLKRNEFIKHEAYDQTKEKLAS